jgi:RNA polymerase sigma factor (sigma-70 family)
MAESLPGELASLLASSDDLAREKAWRVFLDTFSPLILHAARSASTGYDDGMDAYAAALDALRADDCRKLRGYSADPRSKFSTWLVVVVRRICIDAQRERFGRASAKEKTDGISDERAARRRLATLTGAAIELESLPDSRGERPDAELRRNDLHEQLESALADLDERDRLLLTLRFVDDLPARRIAELQGWPDQMMVYRRINQLTALLKQKLLSRGVDSPIP